MGEFDKAWEVYKESVEIFKYVNGLFHYDNLDNNIFHLIEKMKKPEKDEEDMQ